MIANCPSCGTHYKHEPPKAPVTVRCGRCDTTLDLTRFRPYRIVREKATEDDARRAATYLPIGLDHPNLAATIAVNVTHAESMPTPIVPHTDPDHPATPPAETQSATDTVETATDTVETEAPEAAGWTGFVLSVAAGAGAGIAASFTLHGTTTTGSAVGAAVGAAAWWAWRRWTSPS